MTNMNETKNELPDYNPGEPHPDEKLFKLGGASGTTTKYAETQVTAWAATVRESFGRDRKGFNFAVCDALAAAGVQPNANSVLRAGRWGQNTSVAQDVADWYKTLAERLKNTESNIPLSARRHANTLLDQLFSVARTTANEEYEAKLKPLSEQLATTQSALNDSIESEGVLKQSILDFDGKLTQSRQANDALQERLVESGEQIIRLDDKILESGSKIESLQQSIASLNSEKRDLERAAEQAAAQHKQDFLNQEVAHAAKLLAEQRVAEDERRRLMLSVDRVRTEAAEQLKKVQSDLDASRLRVEALNTQNSQVAIQLATAQATLVGANDLLALERKNFAETEATYKSDAYQHASLLNFVGQARKAGITLNWPVPPDEQAVTALGRILNADAGFSVKLAELIPVEKREKVKITPKGQQET
jgi:hypothetical protein